YLTFKALAAGGVRADTTVTESKLAADQKPVSMGLPIGTTMSVDSALKMMVVRSANDMAVALAETVSGTVPTFVAAMNTTAADLGMTGSHFENANGLPDNAQVSSARDLAVLARHI